METDDRSEAKEHLFLEDRSDRARPTASTLFTSWFRRALVTGRRCWPFLVVAAAGFAIRLYAVVMRTPECPENVNAFTDCFRLAGDPMYYELQASQIVDGLGFVGLSLQPSAQHPPLFSLWLGLLDGFGLWSLQAHRIAGAALGALGVFLVALLGRRIGGNRGTAVGIVAGTLAAIYPGFWISDAELRAESLFIPVTAFGILMAHRLWERRALKDAVWFGLAAGLMWGTRPEAILYALFIALAIIARPNGTDLKKRVTLGVISLVIPAVMMTPWVLYNQARFSRPLITTTTGQTLLLNACDNSFYGTFPGYQSYDCLQIPVPPDADEAQVDAIYGSQALSYLSQNRGSVPQLTWIKVRRIWGVYSVRENLDLDGLLEGYQRDGALGTMIVYTLMLPFGAAGLWIVYRRKEPLVPLVLTFVVVTITAATAGALTRFRIPADVALCALSGLAIVTGTDLLRSWWRQRTRYQVEAAARDPIGTG